MPLSEPVLLSAHMHNRQKKKSQPNQMSQTNQAIGYTTAATVGASILAGALYTQLGRKTSQRLSPSVAPPSAAARQNVAKSERDRKPAAPIGSPSRAARRRVSDTSVPHTEVPNVVGPNVVGAPPFTYTKNGEGKYICSNTPCNKATWSGEPGFCNADCASGRPPTNGVVQKTSATCLASGCNKTTWDGEPGFCQMSCKESYNSAHEAPKKPGATCLASGCNKTTWDGNPGFCHTSCKNRDHANMDRNLPDRLYHLPDLLTADIPSNVSCISTPSGKSPPPSADWFSKLFDFSEKSYSDVRFWLKVVKDEHGNRQRLVSKVNQKSYGIGLFGTPTLESLRTRVKHVQLPGKLTVKNELGDVAEKHSIDENRHATFQVASQFNCLEFVNANIVPEEGVAGYAQDRTQGPACSIACGPATVFRNYFARMPAEGDGPDFRPEQFGQTRDRMIDNLNDFSVMVNNVRESMYKVQGGYTQSDEGRLAKLNAELLKLEAAGRSDEVRGSLRVGVHEDVEVTSKDWGQKVLATPGQTVTQVFGSACSVAYSRHQTQDKSWEPLATIVLQASYEATLCAALLATERHPGDHGARRVFLTSLGGGVFGNPMEWIVAAMRRACDKYKHHHLDVRVVTFAGKVHPLLQKLERDF